MLINGSCEECICKTMNSINRIAAALNCYTNRQQCEIFFDYSSSVPYSLQAEPNRKFFARYLPSVHEPSSDGTDGVPVSQSTTQQNIGKSLRTRKPDNPSDYPHFCYLSAVTSISSRIVRSAYWPFDNNFNDFYGVYNGAPVNSANLSSNVGVNGYGKALSVVPTGSQFTEVTSPGFSLVNESFTLEAWVNPGLAMTSNDFLIFGQCTDNSGSNPNRCLNILLRSGKPMISFNWGGDCESAGVVAMNRWSHVAFVHDFDRKTQSVYTNGLLSCFANGSSAYIGGSAAPLRLGGCSRMNMYFNGLIDELVLMTRAKSAAEILEDAALTFRYSFDAGEESYDSG